ncbi:MAG: thioredoxin [Candidatus Ureaplasma intestinipullorum]|uniref:Thioredoxin n=1 Tax=Candidatus Ureaplasma intestinipullorum TaxID=2838770 RepID=A0A9E2KWF4_9BACT|nr:thioredoxin [Candidatus Ureaplasma intestinipullorum]
MILNNKNEFEQIISNNELVVIDFFATWCGPCKMLSPVIENVESLIHDVKFIKVDIDQFNDLASQYKIQSVPTLVFLKNGQEVMKSIGYLDEDALIEKIKSL